MIERDDLSSKSESAVVAYKNGDYLQAMTLLDEVISAAPHSPDGLMSRILRASAYEGGRSPIGKSLERALSDYEVLASLSQEVGSVGIVGIARVLAQEDIHANADRILQLCIRARKIDGSPEAALVEGDVFALAHQNEDGARASYQRALRGGEKVGLLRIARSYGREGKRLKLYLYTLRYLFGSAVRRFAS